MLVIFHFQPIFSKLIRTCVLACPLAQRVHFRVHIHTDGRQMHYHFHATNNDPDRHTNHSASMHMCTKARTKYTHAQQGYLQLLPWLYLYLSVDTKIIAMTACTV